jgi:hypothetical protein
MATRVLIRNNEPIILENPDLILEDLIQYNIKLI